MCRGKSHSTGARRCIDSQTFNRNRAEAKGVFKALVVGEGACETDAKDFYSKLKNWSVQTYGTMQAATAEQVINLKTRLKEALMESNLNTRDRNTVFRRCEQSLGTAPTVDRVSLWERVVDALKRARTAGIAGALAFTLAACGASGDGSLSPEDVHTPVPTQSQTAEPSETEAPVDEPAGKDVPFDNDAPFGIVGLDEVEIPAEAQEAFPDTDLSTFPREHMETLQYALSLGVWEDRPMTVEDIRPLQDDLSPELWEKVRTATETNGAPGISPSLHDAPEMTTRDGQPFTITAGKQPAFSAVAPEISVHQDQAYYSDPDPRIAATGSYWITLDGTTADGAAAQTQYRFDYRMTYLPDAERGFVMDGISMTAELETR